MDIIGYSERGIINALFHEMASASDAEGLLFALLADACFPFSETRPIPGRAQVLIEQSFSDFGDSDALVLIDGQEERTCSVFLEAKVKTYARKGWDIEDEFEVFKSGLAHQTVSSSNLFVQLFYKQQLVEGLRQGGLKLLEKGVPFPAWSRKRRRKIGSNEVVRRGTNRLEAHLGQVFYVAVVPGDPADLQNFFPRLRPAAHESVQERWDVSTWGYLTWSQVRSFCKCARLTRTEGVFEFNEGQVY